VDIINNTYISIKIDIMISSNNTEKYSGRVFEAKENFGIETRIKKDYVSLHNPSDFVDAKLAEFKDKNVEVEITIKIVEIPY
jgi:hypothetical protein